VADVLVRVAQSRVKAPLARTTGAVARIDAIIAFVIVATVVLVPLCVYPFAKDAFRLPKDLLFRAFAIEILAFALTRFIIQRPVSWRETLRDPVVALVAACTAWAAFASLMSPGHASAPRELARIAGCAIFFVAAILLPRAWTLGAAFAVAVPGVINAAIAMSQALRIWSPMVTDGAGRLNVVGLLGNPNDVGVYLMPIAVLCCGVARVSKGKQRAAFIAATVVTAGGIIASLTVTALAASAVAVFVLLARSRRALIIGGLASLAIAAVACIVFPGIAERAFDTGAFLKSGAYDRIVSGRTIAMMSAAAMVKDSPLIGKGPGGFGDEYFDYATRLIERFPAMFENSMTRGVNFGEVHNDHLQILAEYGVIGYGLFLASIVVIWRRVRRSRRGTTDEERCAALIGDAFFVSLLFLMAGQFPLALTSSAMTCLFITALLLRWSSPHARS
jgi:O-antigen ligase